MVRAVRLVIPVLRFQTCSDSSDSGYRSLDLELDVGGISFIDFIADFMVNHGWDGQVA